MCLGRFQHTAARRRLVVETKMCLDWKMFQHTAARRRLGSDMFLGFNNRISFNTQPREGGWPQRLGLPSILMTVSTHSRAKAAGRLIQECLHTLCCFNTQPREGGWAWYGSSLHFRFHVSTHSRAKAAGPYQKKQ